LPELERLKPRLVGGDTPGKRIYPTATVATELLQFMERLAERVQHLGPPVKGADNMLKLASDARKAALDMRLVTPGAPEHPRSKLNLAADEIAAVYRETEHDLGIQLVFLDLGTPKAIDTVSPSDDEAAAISVTETAEEVALLTDVYADLKHKLTGRGIPAHDIRFVHEAKTREERFRLFQAVHDLLGPFHRLSSSVHTSETEAPISARPDSGPRLGRSHGRGWGI
jgi:hypothetical protein